MRKLGSAEEALPPPPPGDGMTAGGVYSASRTTSNTSPCFKRRVASAAGLLPTSPDGSCDAGYGADHTEFHNLVGAAIWYA